MVLYLYSVLPNQEAGNMGLLKTVLAFPAGKGEGLGFQESLCTGACGHPVVLTMFCDEENVSCATVCLQLLGLSLALEF